MRVRDLVFLIILLSTSGFAKDEFSTKSPALLRGIEEFRKFKTDLRIPTNKDIETILKCIAIQDAPTKKTKKDMREILVLAVDLFRLRMNIPREVNSAFKNLDAKKYKSICSATFGKITQEIKSSKHKKLSKEKKWMVSESGIEARITELESRVSVLENLGAFSGSQSPQKTNSSIVSVRLTRKKADRKSPLADAYDLVFDIEFTGNKILGRRRIRDIKGILYFDDVFGDEIIGAKITNRLNIGSGQRTIVEGLLITYTTVLFSEKWKRVLTTDSSELKVRFVVDRVIYESE